LPKKLRKNKGKIMRSKKAIKNIISSVALQAITIICGFKPLK